MTFSYKKLVASRTFRSKIRKGVVHDAPSLEETAARIFGCLSRYRHDSSSALIRMARYKKFSEAIQKAIRVILED